MHVNVVHLIGYLGKNPEHKSVKASGILLPKRTAAFWESGLTYKSSIRSQHACWEEPEKQKTRSCRAQELSRSSDQWRRWNRRPKPQKTGLADFVLASRPGRKMA
jgi:hypothetical protein